MHTICVIPVRAGSKGIPRKNLAEIVDGVCLLEWTIRQARRAYPVEDIFVSTEDAEMARIAADCGVQVVSRPPELAQDASTTASVVEHLLAQVDPEGRRFQAIAILQVTSPLRTVEDILSAKDLMAAGRYDSVVSACEETARHPAKMYFLEAGCAVSVAPSFECSRRQDLPKVFRRNGAIFVVTREHFDRTGRLWGGRTGLVQMPGERSIDIDAPPDLEAARRFLSSRPAEGLR
jgi:CMP-N,N'-diacetyllegionaminic acid synthase